MPPTRRQGKANSKKAAPRSNDIQSSSSASLHNSDQQQPLFEIDTQGSAAIRNKLSQDLQPAQARLRKGQVKPVLRSDQILAQRSAVPALSSRVQPSQQAQQRKYTKKRDHVDRETKERLKRIVGRDDSKGSGLWAVKSQRQSDESQPGSGLARSVAQASVQNLAEFDAWAKSAVDKPAHDDHDQDLSMEAVVALHNGKKPKPKAPSTLRKHQLLGADPSAGPRSIPLPHPGESYNPSLPHHQALLGKALSEYTVLEQREQRGQATKDALDALRRSTQGKELWELYEEEVGSGEEDDELVIRDESGEGIKRNPAKQGKRKTQAQRNAKLRVRAEAQALADRRAAKKRVAGVMTAPAVTAAIVASEELSLADKAAALKAQKLRVAERGLTRFRSGPARVPDQPVTFQLGDELADNLRTLQPEGNLWREWIGSSMRRGKVPVERANVHKKGGNKGGRGHDKNHKTKEVEKYSYKNFKV